MIGSETTLGARLLERFAALEREVRASLERATGDERIARLRELAPAEREELAASVPSGAPIGVALVAGLELRFRDEAGHERFGLLHVPRLFSQRTIDDMGGFKPGYAERALLDPARRDPAAELLEFFRAAWRERFPLVRAAPWHWCAELAAQEGVATDDIAMDWDLTSALAIRPIRDTGRWSRHGIGAVDLSPRHNPWVIVKDGVREVLPPSGAPFALDRTAAQGPLVILPDGWVVQWFKARGWTWGGEWPDRWDYQHFSPGIE